MHVDAIFSAIGRFCARFWWIVIPAWLIAAFALNAALPSLSSVTQGNNTKFLPASAPSMHAATLAEPFGTSNVQPVPVVIARTSAPLTAADISAIGGLTAQFRQVHTVTAIKDLGRSPDGHADQLVVLARFSGGQNQDTDLVNALRAKIAQAHLPPGLRAHLAGDIAIQVDQQKASGNTGNQLETVSALFIIVLLVLIFRSLSLALTTLLPAFIAFSISGPLVALAGEHGLKVSPIAQFLLIVLVLGAGTDYGLFLVFRVREELRSGQHDEQGDETTGPRRLFAAVRGDLLRARPPAMQAIATSVTRVGEAITFSAATVIAALLTLLAATFPFYSSLGAPLAIGIGVMLLAGLTLLPALLSIRLSMLAVKRTIFRAVFGRAKLLPWNIQRTSRSGAWGRIAGRVVRHPGLTLAAGIAFFGALAFGVLSYQAAGFGGNTTPPAGSDSAAGGTLLGRHFPQASANPTDLIFRLRAPAWQAPATLAAATQRISASGLFTAVSGPLNPAGASLTPAQFAALHA